VPDVVRRAEQQEAFEVFEGIPRRIHEADDTAVFGPTDTPDEPKGHEGDEPVTRPDVYAHPPLGRNEPGEHRAGDEKHKSPVKHPRR
jgi:hypothetical protein